MASTLVPVLVVVFLIAVFIVYSIKDTIKAYRSEVAQGNKHLIVLDDEAFYQRWHLFLEQYFPYYQNLDETGKKQFSQNLKKLLQHIDIIGKNDLTVTDEMRVLLLSTLAQLTFGLKKFWLYDFSTVFVYPGAFKQRSVNGELAGVTFKSKIIAVSWQHFVSGLQHHTDGNNVGLHEMAHALKRTVHNGKMFDLHFASYLDTWFQNVKEHMLRDKEKLRSFIPKELSNSDELFAECVERFFEAPQQFRLLFPDAYAHMCVLLNQDPLNSFENYRFDKSRFNKLNLQTSLPDKVKKIYRHHSWHWSYNLPFFNILLVPLCLLPILPDTLVTTSNILLSLVLCSIILALVLYKYIRRIELHKNIFTFFINTLLGITPIFFIVAFGLNDLIPIEQEQESLHQISSYEYIWKTRRGHEYYDEVRFEYADGFLADYPEARTFSIEETGAPDFFKYSGKYDIAKGVIGLPVIKHKRIIFTTDEHPGY